MLGQTLWQTLLEPNRLGIILGCAIPITAIVAGIWGRVASVRSDNELKRTLVEHGLSAEDIERIMNAGRKHRGRRSL